MIKLAVIGASAGGISAIQTVFKNLEGTLPFPIVVVLHLHKDTKLNLNLIFGHVTQRPLIEASDKTELTPGSIYFATPDYHLLIENEALLSLAQDPLVNFSRPSIDVTFESAAFVFGDSVCGVLLTGASADGALGLKTIKAHGGFTIVQDPKEAETPTMPLSALQIMKPDEVLNLADIGKKLSTMGGQLATSKK